MTAEQGTLSPSDWRILIAGISKLGPSADGTVERDLAAAVERIEAERDQLRDQLSSGFRAVTRVAKDALEKMDQAIAERDEARRLLREAQDERDAALTIMRSSIKLGAAYRTENEALREVAKAAYDVLDHGVTISSESDLPPLRALRAALSRIPAPEGEKARV